MILRSVPPKANVKKQTQVSVSDTLGDVKRLLPLVLKRAGWMLLGLHLAREVTLQILAYAGFLVQAQGREDLRLISTVIGLNFFFEVLWSAVWSFAAITLTRASLRGEELEAPRSLDDFNQLVIEGVRSLSAILYRLPLLIIPAIIEVVRLLFVPHVVLLDPGYARGSVDALKRSRQIVRSAWPTLLVSTVLAFAATLLVSAFTQGGTPGSSESWFWISPIAFTFSALLTLFINLVYEIFLVALFMRLSIRIAPGPAPEEDHAHIRLETN